MATVFSGDMIEQWFGETDKRVYTGDVRYRDAAANVRKLLQPESDAIKRLRKQPVFKLMTATTFADAGLGQVPQPLVDKLLRTF